MKKSYFWIFGLLVFAQSWAIGCELDGVDMADGDEAPKYTVISEKDAHFKDKDQFQADIAPLNDPLLSYDLCKDSFIWRVLKAKNGKQVFVALMSDEDDCDGGNSFGVLYLNHKAVGTIEDSVIDCK